MAASSADMFASVYVGGQLSEYEDVLIETACSTGNLGLVRRHWKAQRGGRPSTFDWAARAAQYGQIVVLAWLTEKQREWEATRMLPPEIRGYYSLQAAVCNGDVAMANWLLDHDSYVGLDAGGFDLLRSACSCEHYECAKWIMQKFPIAPSASELSWFINEYTYTAKFLTETFDLEWADLRVLYYELCVDNQEGKLKRKSHSTFRWLCRRFKTEIDRELASDEE